MIRIVHAQEVDCFVRSRCNQQIKLLGLDYAVCWYCLAEDLYLPIAFVPRKNDLFKEKTTIRYTTIAMSRKLPTTWNRRTTIESVSSDITYYCSHWQFYWWHFSWLEYCSMRKYVSIELQQKWTKSFVLTMNINKLRFFFDKLHRLGGIKYELLMALKLWNQVFLVESYGSVQGWR